jgi:hypothetical protein
MNPTRRILQPDMTIETLDKSIFMRTLALLRDNLFSAGVILALIYGWNHRDDNYLSAESGAGYVLGIVGCSMMLILLAYPLSKRVNALTRVVPTRYWFGIHMLFGILGPVLILFHSNFQMGSLNSNIALFCMLVVAGSGIIGRYIYTRIHHGLYGARLNLTDLKNEAQGNHVAVSRVYTLDKKLETEFEAMETAALQPCTGIVVCLWRMIRLSAASRWLQWHSIRLVKTAEHEDVAHTGTEREQMVHSIRWYMKTLRKTAGFQLYERLFSLWHVLHLPLFFMMIIAAVIHIFAVHIY